MATVHHLGYVGSHGKTHDSPYMLAICCKHFTRLAKTFQACIFVGWKPISYRIIGSKNQSFRNKSGKTQPIQTKFRIRGQVKGWQRSGNFGRDRLILGKMGAGTSPAEPEFFCVVIHATFRQLQNGRFSSNLATKRNSVSRRSIRKDSFKTFHFRGHLPPKSEIKSWSNRHLTQSRLQVTGCTGEKYCCSPMASEFPRSINFSVRCTVADLRGIKVAQFSDFGLFSPYKTPKTYLPVTSIQPRGYIAEWLRFFHVVVEGPKGCFPAAEFSCDFW